METRYRDFASRRHSGSLGFGFVVIIIGALLLLNNLDIFRFHDVMRFWPVALIALGLVKALDARDSAGQVAGGLIVLVGAWLLADRLDLFFFPFHFRQLWPLLLIGFGVLLLWKQGERPHPVISGRLKTHAVFGAGKRQFTGEFSGSHLDVVFGGYEVDLREARMTGDEAVLQLQVVFGGVEITVPEDWDVLLESKAVFGGFDDKSRHPLPGTPGAKRLHIVGEVVFGGVTIKN